MRDYYKHLKRTNKDFHFNSMCYDLYLKDYNKADTVWDQMSFNSFCDSMEFNHYSSIIKKRIDRKKKFKRINDNK